MNKNTILITIISLLAIFGFIWGAYSLTSKPEQTSYPEVNKITNTDHIKWSKEKKNILVEFADLQCEACRAYNEYFQQWQKTDPKGFEQVKKNITFVQRHFPLPGHANSQQASYAAEAAAKQAKFFEYANILFREQPTWDKITDSDELHTSFENYARELKLDIDKWNTDMNSKEIKDKVAADMAQGKSFDIQGTPTFFLNGEKVTDVRSFDEFIQKLSELK